MTQAVILAGGAGTRLASVSGGLPKPLVPVAGTPVVERQIALLARYGVDEIFLTTGFGADVLEERLGDGTRLGVRLHHVREQEPLGTAGGVAALRDRLSDDFLVLYGDVLVNMDLARLLQRHRTTAADATIVVHPNDHPFDSDLVDLADDGRVRAFYPKPRPANGPDLPNMVSAALYVLSPPALLHIEPGVSQDFVRDVFPRLLAQGSALYGYATTEYLKDMGTPERLARVEQDVVAGIVDARHSDHRRPTLFLDRDGVINREIDGVFAPDQLEVLEGVGDAVRRTNKAGWLVAVATNQPAIAKGFMSEEDLSRVHLRLERLLGDAGAWLDAIAHCPHHPDRGFEGERPELKIECACRKPAAGLLEQIASRIPVDPGAAVMVGDSWRDMAAAHAFGARAIGIEGERLFSAPPETRSADVGPDVVVADLAEAVSLVLDADPVVEALADRIVRSATASRDAKRLVLLGGCGFSGKSATAFRLQRALLDRGEEVLWLRLEDWSRGSQPGASAPPHEGSSGQRLAQRYDLATAALAVEALVRGRSPEHAGFEARTPEEAFRLRNPDNVSVLIVEGTPALLLDVGCEALRVHCEAASEAVLRLRIGKVCEIRNRLGGQQVGERQARELEAQVREELSELGALAEGADLRLRPRRFRAGVAEASVVEGAEAAGGASARD